MSRTTKKDNSEEIASTTNNDKVEVTTNTVNDKMKPVPGFPGMFILDN